MIACLTPSDKYIDENLSTLNYASKAKVMKNQPKVNNDPNATKINDLQEQVWILTEQLTKANGTIDFMNKMVNDGKGGTHLKGQAGGGVEMDGVDPKELEFIMENPDGQLEN